MSTSTTAYDIAVNALPTTATLCERCKLRRVATMIGVVFDPKDQLPTTPSRFGCPKCEVALLENVDRAAMMWSAVLRNDVDPHWAWLPVQVRAACARAGFGAVKESEVWPDTRVGVVRGHVWAMEGTWGAINTLADAANLPDIEAQMEAAHEREHLRIPDGMGPLVERSMATPRVARGGTHAESKAHVWIGMAIVPLRLVALVEKLYPFAVWHGGGWAHPVVAVRDGIPVALLMGCQMVMDEEVKS